MRKPTLRVISWAGVRDRITMQDCWKRQLRKIGAENLVSGVEESKRWFERVALETSLGGGEDSLKFGMRGANGRSERISSVGKDDHLK